MSEIPIHQKIYHITHINNLEGILSDKVIWSDAKRLKLGLECEIVGMLKIKKRRLEELEVKCHPGTKVGEYAAFYFCPRSIMLYILYKGNHPDIDYHEGQQPIIHLQADLNTTIQWANKNKVRWAFSDRNAGANVAKFYKTLDDLDKINWPAVAATDWWRDIIIKEGKQAEFMLYESFPWELIEKIGVYNNDAGEAVIRKVGKSRSDMVTVEKSWYY
jgi:hypothetical protein